MGGGSAQVNPPYQVSVAEGLTALLGDAVTVVDGVEVRTRPVPARAGFVTDPADRRARRALHACSPRTASCSRSGTAPTPRRWSASTTTSPSRSHQCRLRARGSTAGGPVELGVLGVGDWELRGRRPRR